MGQIAPDMREALRERLKERLRERLAAKRLPEGENPLAESVPSQVSFNAPQRPDMEAAVAAAEPSRRGVQPMASLAGEAATGGLPEWLALMARAAQMTTTPADRSIPGEIGTQLVGGAMDTIQSRAGLLGAAGGALEGVIGENPVSSGIEFVRKSVVEGLEIAKVRVQPSKGDLYSGRSIVGNVARAAPQFAEQVAMGALPGGAAARMGTFALAGAGPVIGQVYNDAVQAGQTPGEASVEAMTAGYATAITSTFPGFAIFADTPTGKAALAYAIRRQAGAVGSAAVAEGSQEMVESVLHEAIKGAMRHDPETFTPEFWQGLGMEGMVGAILGGGAKVVVAPFEGKAATPNVADATPNVAEPLEAADAENAAAAEAPRGSIEPLPGTVGAPETEEARTTARISGEEARVSEDTPASAPDGSPVSRVEIEAMASLALNNDPETAELPGERRREVAAQVAEAMAGRTGVTAAAVAEEARKATQRGHKADIADIAEITKITDETAPSGGAKIVGRVEPKTRGKVVDLGRGEKAYTVWWDAKQEADARNARRIEGDPVYRVQGGKGGIGLYRVVPDNRLAIQRFTQGASGQDGTPADYTLEGSLTPDIITPKAGGQGVTIGQTGPAFRRKPAELTVSAAKKEADAKGKRFVPAFGNEDDGAPFVVEDTQTGEVVSTHRTSDEADAAAETANAPLPDSRKMTSEQLRKAAAQPTAGPAKGPGQGTPVGVAQDAAGRVSEPETGADSTESILASGVLQRLTVGELTDEARRLGVKPSNDRTITEKRIAAKQAYLSRVSAGQKTGETMDRREPAESAKAALRPGWSLETVSDSGSAYLKHEASGEIIRVADHMVPETVEGRAARQPWAKEVVSRLGPTVDQVRKAMDEVESDSATPQTTAQPARSTPEAEGTAAAAENKDDPKQPWEMTRAEFVENAPSGVVDTAQKDQVFGRAHEQYVRSAAAQGKPVPPAVLADYPDIKPAPAPGTVSADTPTQETANAPEEGQKGRPEGLLNNREDAGASQTATPPTNEGGEVSQPSIFEQRLDAMIDRVQKARKATKLSRGRNVGATTLFSDVIYLSAEAALRTVRAGVKGAKAIRAALAKFAADNKLNDRDTKTLVRTGSALIAEARGEDGQIDADRFEAALDRLERETVKRARAAGPTTKQAAEAATGVKKAQPKTITERAALKASMSKASRAAMKGYREGVRLTMIEARDRMNALRKLARGKEATEAGIRAELVRLVEDTLPPALQGKFIAAASKVKTLPQLQRQIARLRDKLADYRLRLGMKDLRKALKRASKMKMLDENKAAIADAAAAERRFTHLYTKKQPTSEKVKLIEAILVEYHRVQETMANQRASEDVRIGNEWWKREEIVTRAVQTMEAAKPDLPAVAGLSADAKASLLGRANQKMLTPDGVGALLIDPKLRQLLSEDNWVGETEVFKGTQAWEDRKKELLEAAGYEWGSDRTQKLSAAVSRDKADQVKIKLPDAGVIEGTPAEMMALFGTLTDLRAGRQIENGTPINWSRNRLGKPIRLSPSDVAAFKAGLDPSLKAIVNGGKQFVEERIRPGVFRAHRQLKGWDLDAVPGYYRTGRNMKQADPARTDTLKDWDGWAQQALTGLGFLKQRVPSSQTPYLIGDFFDDMNEMVHKGLVFAHMGPRVRTMTIVFNDPRLQSTIERKYGAGLLRQIDDTIHAAKLIFKEPADPAERFAAFTSRMYARAVLTLNPRTWMKQLGGIAKLTNEIDIAHIRAATKLLRSREHYQRVKADMLADPWFRERYNEAVWRRVTPALGERVPLLGPTKTTDAMRRLLKLSPGAAGELIDRIEILNWFDMQAAMVAWAAAEHQTGAHERRTEAKMRETARIAQFAFRRTQNTSSPLDMSGFALQVRGKVSSMTIMFTSDANKSYNMLATAIASRDPKKIARASGAVAINAAWAAVVVAMFGELKDLGEDDEKKRKLFISRWSDSFARDLAGMGYFGGDAYDFAKLAVTAAVEGKMPSTWQFAKGFENPIVSNTIDTAEALLNLFAVPSANGYMQSGPNRGQSRRWVYFKRFMSGGASAAGKWFGIPYEPPLNVLRDLYRAGRRLLRSE